MPIARYQLPNGKIARFEVEAGTTPEQVEKMAQDHFGLGQEMAPATSPKVHSNPSSFDPTTGMSGIEKFIAGMGQGVVGLGRGVGQRTGLLSQAEIDRQMKMDAPLLATTPGKWGSVAGNVLAGVPTAFIPGANTLAGASLVGAGFGAAQPTRSDESVIGNTLLGGAAPLVLSPLIKYGAKGIGALSDLVGGKIPAIRASKIARDAAGDNLAAIRQANAAAPKDLTSAQAAYGINQDPYQALEKLVSRTDPDSFYRTLKDKQKQDVIDLLSSVAGGRNKTESLIRQKSAKQSLGAVTDPMRRQALAAANESNLANQPSSSLIKRGEKNWAPLTRQGKSPDIRAPLSQNIPEFPSIQTKPILDEISAKIANPSLGVDNVSHKVLTNVAKKIKDWEAKNGGVIDANALHEIRSTFINSEIDRLLPGLDAKSKAKKTASLLMEIRPLIDQSIVDAGGVGWPGYLKSFSQGANDINKYALGAEALSAYKKSPKAFIGLMEGENPKIMKKIFGGGNIDINKAMGKQAYPLHKAADIIKREMAMKEQAKSGMGALTDIVKKNQLTARLPSLLSRPAAITNKGLDFLEGTVNQKSLAILREGMKNGISANKLMDMLPASERNKVLKAIAGPGLLRPSVKRGAQAALPPIVITRGNYGRDQQ